VNSQTDNMQRICEHNFKWPCVHLVSKSADTLFHQQIKYSNNKSTAVSASEDDYNGQHLESADLRQGGSGPDSASW